MTDRAPNMVFRPENIPIRFFKACRWCRRQKMRCDARDQVPCFRCRSAGRNCILDPIDSEPRRSRRRQKSATPARQLAGSPLDQRAGYHTPTTTEQDFSSLVTARDAGFDTSIDSLPNSVDLSSLRSQNAESSGPKSQQLSPNEMIAPVSAVHSMSVNLLGSDNIFMDSSAKGDPKGDIIARGIVSEENARAIYERFFNGSKNFLGLFDPIRDTFDSIRSRSLFCFTVIIYLASRAVVDLRSNTHMQRVLQDEAQRLAEDSFFERPTKLETVQGMILLAAYSEKTWFSIALILRTALDSGLEKSLDTLLSQENVPRSSLSATMADRQLVWQTRTWLISFTLELDVASGTGRKSRIAEVDVTKLRAFLDYPLSLPADMRTVSIIELHQLRGHSRVIIENAATIPDIISSELPAIMARLQNWWTTWDEIHDQNGFHAGAFQRSSLKLMLHYARIFVFCISLARIQRLQPTYANSNPDAIDENVMNLWQSLVATIMDQLAYLINESSYRYQLTWAPTYPALTIAFVTSQRRQENNDNADMPEHQSGDDRSSSTSYREAADNNANSLIINPPPPVEVGASSHDNEGGNRGPTMHNTTTVKDANMIPTLSNDVPRPPLSRLPEMMEVPNWATMSNSIADSFGLFEEGQNDIFDFLHTMPSIPQ
uniref:Protein priB n=1 Tax=Talaromyces marneffei PM1 TaxID=1077442 RepID=A0A093W3L8_TALMA